MTCDTANPGQLIGFNAYRNEIDNGKGPIFDRAEAVDRLAVGENREGVLLDGPVGHHRESVPANNLHHRVPASRRTCPLSPHMRRTIPR